MTPKCPVPENAARSRSRRVEAQLSRQRSSLGPLLCRLEPRDEDRYAPRPCADTAGAGARYGHRAILAQLRPHAPRRPRRTSMWPIGSPPPSYAQPIRAGGGQWHSPSPDRSSAPLRPGASPYGVAHGPPLEYRRDASIEGNAGTAPDPAVDPWCWSRAGSRRPPAGSRSRSSGCEPPTYSRACPWRRPSPAWCYHVAP